MLRSFVLSVFATVSLARFCLGAEPTEEFLKDLPPGIFVESSKAVPAEQTQAVARRLGAKIERLTYSVIRIHGSPIGINGITAPDEANAIAIQKALPRPGPFSLRKGRRVIEYVGGRNLDPARAAKASYELGFVEKPRNMTYRVTAELALIDKADYMSCNPLFQRLLAARKGGHAEADRQIQALTKKFTFGSSLSLRSPSQGKNPTRHSFQPAPTGSEERGAGIIHTFGKTPTRHGIPFVTATLQLQVDDTGFFKREAAPARALTAATPLWPADDHAVKALAAHITKGKADNGAKAMAILEWLAPGKNIKYSGQTGSRWGVAEVLEQRFGHCWDFSDCFVTLARAAGVPSRQVAGWIYGGTGHVWAEFYREEKGWQQIDPSGGGKLPCGIYHIPYFTTEDGELPLVYLSLPKIEGLELK